MISDPLHGIASIAVYLPSIARVVYSLVYYRGHKRIWQGYYNGYPENWADVLGERYW
jgi:hypothetical protein